MKSLFDVVKLDYNTFIGRTLGNVTLLKELGRGAKGVVFTGFQKSLKRQVAVKVIPRVVASTQEAYEQFMEEAEIVAALNHPNIIPIFEIGEESDVYYQVIQLVIGYDIDVLISKAKKHPVPSKRLIPIKRTLGIVIDVLDGLGYAHEEEVVHQDIKPANILIEERSSRPLIVDFGIAKTAETEFRSQGIISGTPIYISPEQAAGKETDGRADIYSMGVLMIKMLAGGLPRRNERPEEILKRKITDPYSFFTARPSAISPLIDEKLEQIIDKACEPDLSLRFQTCAEFKSELQNYVATL